MSPGPPAPVSVQQATPVPLEQLAGVGPAPVVDRPRSDRSSSLIVLSTVLAGALNYGYTFLAAGLLAPSVFSIFSASAAALLVAGTVANASLPWVLARQLALAGDDRQARTDAVWFVLVCNAGQGLVAGAVTFGALLPVVGAAVAGVAASAALAFFLASTPMGWAQGTGRFGLLAVLVVAEVAVKVALGAVLMATGGGALAALAAVTVGAVVVALGGTVVLRSDLRPSWASLRLTALWAQAGGMIAVQGLTALLAAVDTIVVLVLAPDARDTPSYQVSATLGRVPVFLALAVGLAVFPRLVGGSGTGALDRAYRRFLVGAGGVALLIGTAPPALLRPFLGDGYASVPLLLPLTAASGFCFGLLTLQTTVLRAVGAFRSSVVLLLLGLLAMAAGTLLGDAIAGVGGLAVGVLLAATASTLLTGRAVRVRWPTRTGLGLPDLAVLTGLGLALALARGFWPVWVVVAAVGTFVAAKALLDADPAEHPGTPERKDGA